MPRLSLYKPEKSNDFKFLDKVISEEFQVGGVDVFVHKYLGPVNPGEGESSPTIPTNNNEIPELGIQDLLFGENRDRNYSEDVYVIRGVYDMQDIDFNLSQFGMFLQNDTIFMMFHLRGHYEALGRKIMSGDVLELPHLKDEYALNDKSLALKRFYVVQDVARPAKGYSSTWYPHLIRAKCIPMTDSQEFSGILDKDAGDGSTIKDLLSDYNKNIEINNQIINQAESDAPKSGYETKQYYVIPTRPDGLLDVADASDDETLASVEQAVKDASVILNTPTHDLYVGYLTGNGLPPNGAPYGFGIIFPSNPIKGQFFLRNDYLPNRLFRFDGNHWIKYEDNVRMTLNNFGYQDVAQDPFVGKDVQSTQKTSFINNNNTATIAGEVVVEKQALSKVLRPRADN